MGGAHGRPAWVDLRERAAARVRRAARERRQHRRGRKPRSRRLGRREHRVAGSAAGAGGTSVAGQGGASAGGRGGAAARPAAPRVGRRCCRGLDGQGPAESERGLRQGQPGDRQLGQPAQRLEPPVLREVADRLRRQQTVPGHLHVQSDRQPAQLGRDQRRLRIERRQGGRDPRLPGSGQHGQRVGRGRRLVLHAALQPGHRQLLRRQGAHVRGRRELGRRLLEHPRLRVRERAPRRRALRDEGRGRLSARTPRRASAPARSPPS